MPVAMRETVVAALALVFLHAGWLLRAAGPLFARYLAAGLPAGPNALLTVRGRSSGRPYQVPVALWRLGERRFVQAASGEAAWVRNLRAHGQAVLTAGRQSEAVTATELGPETGGALMHDALASFPRSRLVRRVVGPEVRPPAGVLADFRLRVDDALDAYVGVARRQPLFELRARG